MDCKCPKGWPQRYMHGFGHEAVRIALKWGVPPPGFGVVAHRQPCGRPNEVEEPVMGLNLRPETSEKVALAASTSPGPF